MLKTVLIIILINLANPAQSPELVHKAFNDQQACQKAYENVMSQMPTSPSVKVSAYCADIADLADADSV